MTSQEPAFSRRQLVVFTAWAIGLGLAVLCMGAEVALRLAGRRPAYLDPDLYIPLPDARGYGLRPGYRGLYAGGRVTVGPLGLRGRAEPGGVLLLGDSAGFGQGLDDDQTVAAQLERLLAEKGHPLPVINAGVPGYNTTLQLAQLRLLLPQLRPRQVVLLYVVDNDADLRPGVWVRPDGTLELHLSQSLPSRLSRFLTRHLVTYALVRGLFRVRQMELPQEPRTPFAPDDPGWHASRQALVEMHRLLSAAGIPLAVGGIALVQNLDALTVLEQACRAEGIPYTTLWQTRDIAEFVRRYAISRTDSHPNAAATARMAEALLPLIVR
ncbi:MAG: GDSL-type esterase/lipase family protein [Myxococcales bacterium]|nr:GDSL-type esterase/lipase family protein [Myxococcota bacterium]MDW8281082.1 GDSL-type esterase/lipase family protein [Myxococcales bacterium]